MIQKAHLLLGIFLAATVHSAMAAKRLGPPIEELQSAPERFRIARVEVLDKPATGKLVLAVRENLTGDSPDEVTVRVNERDFNELAVGGNHIVAWTDQRRNRRIGGWEDDPEGPYVLRLEALGSTALFENNREIRLLFTSGAITDPDRAANVIEALLAQMQREDERSRGLVIMELWLREDLAGSMNDEQLGQLGEVIRDPSVTAQHLELLFRTAMGLPADRTAPWLAEELRRTIIWNGTQYDLRTFIPALVRTAAKGLGMVGAPGDVDILDPLLYSNNPGVSKAAITAMDQLDRDAAVARAQKALERGWVHSETRYALNRYLAQFSP